MSTMSPLPTYTLRFINDSRNPWTFCVYLSPPEMNVPNPMAMAWLTADAAPTTHVALQWTLDYGFMWIRTSVLTPGNVILNACQSWPADLELKNQVTYTTRYGQPTFTALKEAPNEAVCTSIKIAKWMQASRSSGFRSQDCPSTWFPPSRTSTSS